MTHITLLLLLHSFISALVIFICYLFTRHLWIINISCTVLTKVSGFVLN